MLLLASNSPRRKQLLGLAGWEFKVQPAEVDESLQPGEAPDAYVLRLAERKARAAAERSLAEEVLVAADTTVVDADGTSVAILGKPADALQAEQMLRRLRGRSHQVFTAVAALRRADDLLLTDICATDVPMRDYTDSEMLAYISTGDPFDKAGAYAIQHPGFHPVEELQGCYANVVGLPLCHLRRLLVRLGVPPQVEIPAVCRQALDYRCEYYRKVI